MLPLHTVFIFFFCLSRTFYASSNRSERTTTTLQYYSKMFSPPVYVSVGDDYEKRIKNEEQKKVGDKPFKVTARKHPHTNDSTFSPFVSLNAGDPYKSTGFDGPFRSSSKNSKEGSTKANPVPFRPSGGSKKSSGKGDYYGTFSEGNPYKHETELPPVKNASTRRGPEPRNFVVNRPKKGTYGYAGTTIGNGEELKYVHDPYEGTQRREALERKAAASRNMGAPFKATVHRQDTFDESEHGYSKVYSLSKPLPPKKTPKSEPKPVVATPWMPGGALRKEITQFPEYMEDPVDLKEKKMKEERLNQERYNAWKPAGNHRNDYVYTKPVPYDPPMVN
ncbi:hypothetical protein AGDE_12150 [Angomonas deanei]|nr:hypothetical protein AGDE_12150 [Angomonas deanei]|eukprot:EPY24831.1 hypothetical protein AGDE_12150 [Angomonas deanei]